MTPERKVVIAGAGLAGSLLAVLLARRGVRVHLLESRPDPRGAGAEEGRSINLALSARGLAGLEAIGLREEVERRSILLRGRLIHARDGSTAFQPYGTGGQGIRSIHRGDLNTILLGAAEAAGVAIRFGARVVGVDSGTGDCRILTQGREEQIGPGTDGFLVGADGAYSAVRSAMQRRDRFEFSQSYLTHGYKELEMPPAERGGHRLDPEVMHIWPRGGYMMMAMANQNGSFTVTLYLPYRGGFDALHSEDDVRAFFERDFADAIPHLPSLTEDFARNPTGSLVTVRCAPWHVEGRMVLVGDAAHAVVPFYGQGANAAFEDCLALDACLAAHLDDPGRAFEAYFAERKPHADALAELAVDNFVEMRDRVASRVFLAKKALERFLHRMLGDRFLPLYTMVSFTRIPYADARDRARRQWRSVTLVALVPAVILLGVLVALV